MTCNSEPFHCFDAEHTVRTTFCWVTLPMNWAPKDMLITTGEPVQADIIPASDL